VDCPICKCDGADRKILSDAYEYTCRRCGKFGLTGTADAVANASEATSRAIANASGWIWEHQGIVLGSTEFEALWQQKSPTVDERAGKLLQALADRYPQIGTRFDFDFPDIGSKDPSWIAATWSDSIDEVRYLLVNYLHESSGAVAGAVHEHFGGAYFNSGYLTPHAYQLLQQMREANPESAIGFCAMWFADELKPLWTQGIEPAIKAAGYDPKRIDQHEHVNRIDDEIVAMIRRSRFVVADFTGHRGGVYFEAGYALALGLRVIWLCREDALADVHFDTRQYNFLVWKAGQYADIAKRLQNRIEATLGRGPLI
jgi:hypothetical protein